MDPKEKEEHSLVKNKRRILNGSQKKLVLGGPKEEEARRVHREVKNVKVVFTLKQKRVQAGISTRTKAEARTEKERAKKVLILNLDFQLRKHPVKKEIVSPGNQTIGIPASLTILVRPLNDMVRNILHGWHQSF